MSGVYGRLAGTVGTQGLAGGRWHKGALGGNLGGRGVGGHFGGIRGCRGVRGILGWQVDWEPNHIGLLSRVPALPLVPWGSDLPGQGQASDRNELCRLLYTFGTICQDSFTFVSMPPHDIFLYAIERNVIWTVFSADQFMHILTLSM